MSKVEGALALGEVGKREPHPRPIQTYSRFSCSLKPEP
jgi:hypothetical protein